MLEVTGEGAKYWPRWRGPSGQGEVPAGEYVDRWSPTLNVQWKVAVPGSGNSSPIVWGDRIFLTTARDNGRRLSMLAFARKDGSKLWEADVPYTGVEYVHYKNGYASATPATDGQFVYASFGRHGLAAFDFNGKLAWHRKFGVIDNYHGPAGSPVLYKDRIFLYQDQNPVPGQTAFVAAFDKKTGNTIWNTPRRETIGWGTAVVINTGTRDELVVSSQQRVAAYDPDSGKELWTVRGMTLRSNSHSGGRARLRVHLVWPRRADAGDSSGRQRRCHIEPRRVELAARITVRAVGARRWRSAVSDQRHAEHPHRGRGRDRQARLPGSPWRRDARGILGVAGPRQRQGVLHE